MLRLIVVLAAALVLLFFAYNVWPPLAATRLASALERGDNTTFAQHVDIDAIRRSLAREVGRAYLDQIGQRPTLAERRAAIARASALTQPIVDEIITPESVASFLKSGRIERTAGAPIALDAGLPTFAALAKKGLFHLAVTSDPDALNQYILIGDAPGVSTRYGLVFQFTGGTWRLAELDLPRKLRLQVAGEIGERAKP
jgi:hypothetical protein